MTTRALRALLSASLAATALTAASVAVAPGPALAAPATGPVGAAETQLSPAAGDGADATATAYHPASGRFLNLWTATRQVTPGPLGLKQEIWSRWTDAATGAPTGPATRLISTGADDDGSTDVVDPALVWDAADGVFVIAYAADTLVDAPSATFDDTTFRVEVRTLVPGGALSAPVPVESVDPGSDARHPDVDVRGAAGRVVWQHTGGSGASEVRSSRLVEGLPFAPVVTLSGSAPAFGPRVALRADGRAMTAWTSDTEVGGGTTSRAVAVVSDTGGTSGTPVQVGDRLADPAAEELDVDVAATPDGQWRLAWSGNTAAAPDEFRVRLATVGITGSNLDSISRVGAVQAVADRVGEDLAPTLTVNGDGDSVVAWVLRNGTDHRVWGARVGADGTTLDAAVLRSLAPGTSLVQPSRPAVAWSSRTRGTSSIAWADGQAWSRLLSGPNASTADLALTMSFAPAAPSAPVAGVEPGTAAAYTLTYRNDSDPADPTASAAESVEVVLPLPAGVVADGAPTYPSTPAGATVSASGTSTLTVTVSGLEPGETGQVVVPVRLAAGLASGTTRTATATISAAGNTDPDPTDDTATAAFTSDDKPYVVSVAAPSPALVGGSAVFEVTFSEPVTGFGADDLVLETVGTASGTITAVNGTGTTRSVVVATEGDGNVRLAVLASATATDSAAKPLSTGNLALRSAPVTVDTTRPTAQLTAPAGPLPGPFAVTVTFSEPVVGLDPADLVVSGGTVTSLSGSGTGYTAQVTPSADGPIDVDLPAGAVLDAAGNPNLAAATLSRVVDATRPSVVLSAAAGPRRAPYRVTVDFSEPVTGFGLGDLTVVNASLTDLQGAGASYSVLVTPTAQGDVTVGLPAGAASDPAGNTNTAATPLTRVFDTAAPTVVASAPAGPVRGAFEVTYTFSEPVTGLDVGDVVVTNGAASAPSGSGTTYTVTVTPAADGEVLVDLLAGAASDAAGNPSLAAATLSRVFDGTRPSVGLSAAAGPRRAPFRVDVVFSEAVTGFGLGDLAVDNGSASDLQGSGTTYSVLVTPAAQGDVTVGLPAGAASDPAGNTSTAASPLTRVFDSVAPTVVASAPAGPLAGAFDVTFTFSESVTGLAPGDVVVGNGTVSSLSGSGTTYTARITPAADGPVSVDLPAGAASDAAGNPSQAAAALTRLVDGTSPTVDLSATSGPRNAPFRVDVVFSEPVTGFALGDLAVDNGSASDLQGAGASYSVLVTPAVQGDVTVGLPAGAASDSSGNTSTAAAPLTRLFDSVAPTVLASAPTGPVRAAFEVTFTFSEAVTGLAVGDVVVGNGSASSLSGSGTTYTVTITPAADGPVSVDLPAGAASDVAGNPSQAAATLTRVVDGTRPSVDLGATSGPRNAPFRVDVVFSEPVTGFGLGDLTVDNGSASDLQGSGSTYSVLVTPAAEGDVTVGLPSGAASDAAGNTSTAAAPLTRLFDSVEPTVVASAPAGPLPGPFEVTFAFSEAVSGLAVDDVMVTNGTASSLTGDGTTFTVTITPAADGPVSVDLPAGAASDVAGNLSQAAATLTRVVDGTRPSVELRAAQGPRNAPFRVDVVFSESVDGLRLSDLVVDNGTVSDLDGSDRSYSVLVTPTAQGDVTVRLPEGAVYDVAGNLSTAATPLTRTFDSVGPTVVASAPAGPVREAFEVTLTFSEAVTGLDVGDLAVGNGEASSLSGSGTTYTVTITPAADGEVTVDLPAGAAADAAGNPSAEADRLTVLADASAPTTTLSTTAADPTNAASITVDVVFSEPVTGLTLDDLAVTGGSASALTGTGATYAVTLTFDPAGDGATLTVPAGAASDAAGNPSSAASLTRAYDGTAPVVALTRGPGQPDPVRTDEVVVVVTASEPVGDLDPADVLVTGRTGAGSVDVERTGPRAFELTVSGMTRTGAVQVALAAGALSDPAGNASAATGSLSVRWSTTTPPTLGVLFDHRCLGASGGAGVIGLRLTSAVASTVSFVSSNPALLPSSRVRLLGSSDSLRRRLQVRPVAGRSGVARLTVVATNVAGTSRLVVRVVVGTPRADRIRGTDLADIVLARGGDDVVTGGAERDLLCGGTGDDRLEGGEGRDALYGQAGDDVLVSGGARDRLVGGPGADRLFGVRGRDELTPRALRSALGW